MTFTPTLMFGANTTPIFSPACFNCAFCSSEKPVVPMIIFTLWRSAASRCAIVPSGRVKSIRIIGVGEHALDVVGQQDARGLAEERARVLPELRHAGPVERADELRFGIVENGFDQHPAHAARCPGDGDLHGSLVLNRAQDTRDG